MENKGKGISILNNESGLWLVCILIMLDYLIIRIGRSGNINNFRTIK
jgi:hypothetical protein